MSEIYNTISVGNTDYTVNQDVAIAISDDNPDAVRIYSSTPVSITNLKNYVALRGTTTIQGPTATISYTEEEARLIVLSETVAIRKATKDEIELYNKTRYRHEHPEEAAQEDAKRVADLKARAKLLGGQAPAGASFSSMLTGSR